MSPRAACAPAACTRSPTSPSSTADRGLRALGGRRAAERWLEGQDRGLDVPALERALAEHAGVA